MPQKAPAETEGKYNWLQVRLSDREVTIMSDLVAMYNFRDKAQLLRFLFAHVARTKPVLEIWPDEEDDGVRKKYMQMKMDNHTERQRVTQLATHYGLSDSDFTRMFLRHIWRTRPKLVIGPIEPAPAPGAGAEPDGDA